jgi:hypothetical protein
MNKRNFCDFETETIKFLKSGEIDEKISAHIESCADCRETAKIMHFFQTNLLNEPSPPKKLPAAGLIWWKSRLREKHKAAEQINRPILIVQTIAALVFIGVFFWLFNSDSFQNSFLGTAFYRVLDSMAIMLVPFFIGIFSLTFFSLLTSFILRRYLLEK